ncbi:hypothetical protein TNCV_963501 [Trichonephila clavipes]|nr:hypothetical protein TNCV_963501 [Trichonephila clavipes]
MTDICVVNTLRANETANPDENPDPGQRVVSWLEHRTPDRKAWGRCLMPPNTLRGTGECFPPLHSHGKIVEVEIGCIVPSGNFAELIRTVTCLVLRPRSTTGVLLASYHDSFNGPRSDYVGQVALSRTTTEAFAFGCSMENIVLNLSKKKRRGNENQGNKLMGARVGTDVRFNPGNPFIVPTKKHSRAVRTKNPEGTEVVNMVANDVKMVTKVAKLVGNLIFTYDANLALSPRFRQVHIESPL